MKGVSQTSLPEDVQSEEEYKGGIDDSLQDQHELSSADNATTDADSSAANNDLANLLNPSNIQVPPSLHPQLDKLGADDENAGKCQFCGISSPEFLSAEKMDLHYVLQCTMLTNCAGCTQIIEVSSYTEHKLN